MNLYEALALAETGGEENPWIRTRVIPKGGSSAFGPVQITKGLLESAIRNKVLSSESAEFAQQVMLPMQQKFLQHGNTGKLPAELRAFDYGGTGNFDVESHGDMYRQLANELIQHELKRTMSNGNIDLDAFLKAWRGKSPEKKYRHRFYKGLKKKGSHYAK